MAITLKEIAELAGVSVTTASMVLRDYPIRCSADVEKRIKEIAAKSDYIPNYAAVSLKKRKTDSIGIIVPDIENMFFSGIVKKLSGMLSELGFTILLCDADDNINTLSSHIEMLKRQNVDAMILAFSINENDASSVKLIETINKLKIPHLMLDTYSKAFDCGCVGVDHCMGAEMAMEHLISNGHRRIACITGGVRKFSAASRYHGFINAMNNHGIPVDEKLIVCGDYTFNSGYEGAKELLKNDITAIFAFNDMMAYGAMKAVNEAGLRIPDDISLIGFDDVMFSSMTYISLTTVRQPMDEIAGKVYGEIKSFAETGIISSECKCYIKPELIIRDSVKKIN